MKLSLEISLYPFNSEYKLVVKDFLNELNQHGEELDIRSNNMSTRVFGDYDAVMQIFNKTMRYSMTKFGKMALVCKFVEGDTRELRHYD